jgi:hypothetical protein
MRGVMAAWLPVSLVFISIHLVSKKPRAQFTQCQVFTGKAALMMKLGKRTGAQEVSIVI